MSNGSGYCQCHTGVANHGKQKYVTDESTSIRNSGDAYEIYDVSGKICQSQYRLLSGGAVRRSSLRCAPFGPPTVSCVLAPARTCLRQAPPTSRGRGLATSAVPHHLPDDMQVKAFALENGVRKRHFLPRFRKFEQTG